MKRTRPARPRIRLTASLLGLAATLIGCSGEEAPTPDVWREGPPLPIPVTNNAVVGLEAGDGAWVYSLMGLTEGKTWLDVTNRAFRWRIGEAQWEEIEPVPGPGRLAATAQAWGGRVYLFGGYTVAEDGAEKSLSAVDVFDPAEGSWSSAAPIPVPVDDAVSGVYRDSLVVLVSGWHDTDNVPLVQLYDPAANRWLEGTRIPGPPVFGHTGTLVRDRFVYVDGTARADAPSRFAIAPGTWLGELAAEDPSSIDWTELPAHPGEVVYRGASAALAQGILFVGGTDNPYNYNGIGYDGVPSEPLDQVLFLDVEALEWREVAAPFPTMDHRSLAVAGGRVTRAGGMSTGQLVVDRVVHADIEELLRSAR